MLCLPLRQVQITFDRPVPPRAAVERPGLLGRRLRRARRIVLDGHLREADHVVAVDDDRREPLVGELEREPGELVGLDHARRRQRDRAVVAPAAAASALEVVLLAAAHGEDHERAAR